MFIYINNWFKKNINLNILVGVDLDGSLTDNPGGGVIVYNNDITSNDPSCKTDTIFSNAVICPNKNTIVLSSRSWSCCHTWNLQRSR